MKAIVQLMGPAGVGKTLLGEALIQELAAHATVPLSILIIDATPDRNLSQQFSLEGHQQTLAGVVQGLIQNPNQPKEAIDWAFSDLAVSVGHEIDLVTAGPLSEQLPGGIEKMLVYGLTRFIRTYDFVLIDGAHPLIRRLMPAESLRTLIILTPEKWDSTYFNLSEEEGKSLSLILNKLEMGGLPPEYQADLDHAMEAGQVRLIGKFPRYETQEVLQRELPSVIRNSLLRLDLPFSASSSSSF
jgi:cellulose biosynthesis protein BcsQ